jgi:hypothetical protein
MSAPKKPAGGSKPQARTLAAVSKSLSELTPGEIRWVAAYRKMDHEARDDHLRFAEATALAHPMRGSSAPSGARGLRLAAAFGKAVAG